MIEMEINHKEALAILEMAGNCRSEGLLGEDAFNLAKRVLLEWSGEKEASGHGNTTFYIEGEVEGRLLYTDYLKE